MISIDISVQVDGRLYGVDKQWPVVGYENHGQEALEKFDKEVEAIRNMIRANMPTDKAVADDRPKIERRDVDSGPVTVKGTKQYYVD